VARDREALQPPDDVGEPEPDELDLGLLDVTQHLLPQIGSRARGSLDRLHGSPFLDSGHKKTPPRGSARSRLEASSPLATNVVVSGEACASYTRRRTRSAPPVSHQAAGSRLAMSVASSASTASGSK